MQQGRCQHNEAWKAAAQTKRRLAEQEECKGGEGCPDKRSDSFLSRSSLEVGGEEEGGRQSHWACRARLVPWPTQGASSSSNIWWGSLMNHPCKPTNYVPPPATTVYIPLIGKSCRHAANRRQYGQKREREKKLNPTTGFLCGRMTFAFGCYLFRLWFIIVTSVYRRAWPRHRPQWRVNPLPPTLLDSMQTIDM